MINPSGVLIVDDDPEIVQLLKLSLSKDFQVGNAGNGSVALEMLLTGAYGIVLLDLMMPGLHGLDILEVVQKQWPQMKIIIVTAYASFESAIAAIQKGAYDFITKPFSPQVVRAAVQRAAGRLRLENYLEAIHKLGQEMALTHQIEGVAHKVLNTAKHVLGFERCHLFRIESDKEHLTLYKSIPETRALRLPLEKKVSVAARAAREARPVYVPDLVENPNSTPLLGGRSEMAVPLQVCDRVIGVLDVVNEQPGAFSPDDVLILTTLADQAALALENARLHESEQELRSLLQQSQAYQLQHERLALTGRMTVSLAHEMNNVLQTIHNGLEFLLVGSMGQEMRRYLQISDEEIERLMQMASRILDFVCPSEQPECTVKLNRVIDDVITLANKFFQHNHILVHTELEPNLPPVAMVPGEVKQIFLNLFINAAEAMPSGGNLVIKSQMVNDEYVEVSISDTGIGLDPDAVDRIFEPFYSTKEKGSGLGLAIVKTLIEGYGGQIEVESKVNEGSTFRVRLPLVGVTALSESAQ